jgi:hypothetical protein
MPLFMALSGYLFIYSGGIKSNFSYFIKGKILRLLLPYVFISSIAFVPKVLLSKFAMRPVDLSLSAFIHNLISPADNVIIFFWFLPTLFLIFVLSPILVKCIQNTSYTIVVSLILLALNYFNPFENIRFLNITGVSYYLVYFWIGCLLAYYKNNTETFFKNEYTFIISFLLLLTTTLFFYNVSVYIFIVALIGIIMSFSLATIFEKHNVKLFNIIDGYSYQIYLLSWFFQTFFVTVVSKVLHLNYWIPPLFMFLGGLLLPVLVTNLISKFFPIFNVFIGKKYKSNHLYEEKIKLVS